MQAEYRLLPFACISPLPKNAWLLSPNTSSLLLKPAPPSPLGSSLTPYTQLSSWFMIGCLSAVISVHQRLKKPPPGLRFPRGVLNPTNVNATYPGRKMGVRLRRYESVLHDGLEVRRTRCLTSPYDGLPT